MNSANPVWLFDGVCVLCSRAVQFALRYETDSSPDQRIHFVAIQSARGRALATAHGLDPDDPQSFLFIDHGKALARSDGVIGLARRLRWPARGMVFLRVLPRPLRDRLYDLIARNRYRWFGKTDQCLIPDPSVLQRFTLPDAAAPQKQAVQ